VLLIVNGYLLIGLAVARRLRQPDVTDVSDIVSCVPLDPVLWVATATPTGEFW